VACGLPPIAIKAFRTLKRFQFDTNCLMLFASVGAVALQDFSEAAAVVFLFALSEWLEVRATSRARRALSAIVHLRPDRANLLHPTTQELITVPATSVPVGALVSVMTGDKIPCDGVVVEGRSTVDESSLSGESRPIRKGPNDKVSGGTVNSGLSQLVVKTTCTSENSAVSRLIRLVEEAQTNRSATEKLVDEFARWYTPVVVFAAALMCSIPWAFGSDIGKEWTANGLILIVVACPCALVISTPVSYVAGLAATAQKGILIKGGSHLEALGMAKNVCFDKTGTLSNGVFALLHLRTVPGTLSRSEVLQYLALMEERASHPVAHALLMAAKNESVSVPKDMSLEKHMINAGEGVEGVINGLSVHVGNDRLFMRLELLEVLDATIKSEVESWKGLGGTVGYMSVEGHGIVCAYCTADGIREESAGVVHRLKERGIDVYMLTGDNLDAALAIGNQVGLTRDRVKSNLLPEEKLRFVEELSNRSNENRSAICIPCGSNGTTIMCGDGVSLSVLRCVVVNERCLFSLTPRLYAHCHRSTTLPPWQLQT
jgi:Zn2+/Cd2+-exporting ATPase